MGFKNVIHEILHETLGHPDFKAISVTHGFIGSNEAELGFFVTLNNRLRNELGIDYNLSLQDFTSKANTKVYLTTNLVHKVLKRKKCFSRVNALNYAKYLYKVEHGQIACLIGGTQAINSSHGNRLKFICDDIQYNERRLIATGARLMTGPKSQLTFKSQNRNYGASQFLEAKVISQNTISVRIKPNGSLTENIYFQLMAVFSVMNEILSITPSRNANMFILEIANEPKPKGFDIEELIDPEPAKPKAFEDTIVSQLKSELIALDKDIESKKELFNKAKTELQELVVRRDRAAEAINVLIGK